MVQQEELASLLSEASDKVVQQEELASLLSEASDKEKLHATQLSKERDRKVREQEGADTYGFGVVQQEELGDGFCRGRGVRGRRLAGAHGLPPEPL